MRIIKVKNTKYKTWETGEKVKCLLFSKKGEYRLITVDKISHIYAIKANGYYKYNDTLHVNDGALLCIPLFKKINTHKFVREVKKIAQLAEQYGWDNLFKYLKKDSIMYYPLLDFYNNS